MQIYLYFARLRARRLQTQTTHVWVTCVVHPEPGFDILLSLEQRTPRLWSFVSAWSLARSLISKGFERVLAIPILKFTNDNYSSIRFPGIDVTDPGTKYFNVWPGVYKRPPRPQEEGPPVDGLAPKKKNSERRTAGVAALSPATALGRQVPRAAHGADVGVGGRRRGGGMVVEVESTGGEVAGAAGGPGERREIIGVFDAEDESEEDGDAADTGSDDDVAVPADGDGGDGAGDGDGQPPSREVPLSS